MNRQMNSPVHKHWILEQLDKNLFAVVVGAAFIFNTSQTTDAVTAKDMQAFEKRLGSIETKLTDRRGFMGCAVRSIDKMAEKTGVNLPCDLQLPE